MKKHFLSGMAVLSIMLVSISCKTSTERYSVTDSEIGSVRELLKEQTNALQTTAVNLSKMDTFELAIFSRQDWKRLPETHSTNVKVNWPDGHSSTGLAKHTEDLKAMFVFAPNTSITQQQSRFGSGNMTCVTATMKGTFTAPMPLGLGKSVLPTGKSFSLPVCIVATWKDGLMTEESFYWDTQSYLDQLGIKE